MSKDNNIYFATLRDSTFLDQLLGKVTVYRNFYQTSGLADRWSLSLGNKFGVQPDGKTSWRVTSAGEDGELVQMKVNEYASYVKHEHVLAIKDRPAGIAKAVNSDVKTLRDARVGSQLVEYYLSDPEHSFAPDYENALLIALLAAEAYVVQDWDTSRGDEIAADEMGNPIRQGDITQSVYGPWDAARDVGAPDSKRLWYIFSRQVNKFERAAEFPAYAEEILTAAKTQNVTSPFYNPPSSDSDYIEEFIFIHPKTKAVPNGRYVRFTTSCIYMDVDFPYETWNVHRVHDENLLGSSFGHTSNYDLLGVEQVTDAMHSIILNNQQTFGIATLVGPKGVGVTHQDLAKGMRYFEVDPQYVDKIKVLDLVRTAPEIFNYLQILSGFKGQLSGINSILRGDPEGALKGASGSAMALLQSQAIVYNSGAQSSYYALLSSCGTGIIEMCRQFADEPRIVKIAGKANTQAVKEFKYDADTLASVSTVIFEPVNPVLQTAAGKLALADTLLEKGMITSAKNYIEVFTTGNLSVLLDGATAMADAILEENEFLTDGQMVRVVAIENHKDHIAGHQVVIASPNSKKDAGPGGLVARVTAHIQEHVDMWTTLSRTNPALLIATGQQVLPLMPEPGMPAPGGAPGAPGPTPPAGPQIGGPQNSAPGSAAPGMPNLPKPPVDPGTGDRAPVAPGTSIQQAA